jgi:hypothetical protein
MKKFLIVPLLILLTLSSTNPSASLLQKEQYLPSHTQSTLNDVLNIDSDETNQLTSNQTRNHHIPNLQNHDQTLLSELVKMSEHNPTNLSDMSLNILNIMLEYDLDSFENLQLLNTKSYKTLLPIRDQINRIKTYIARTHANYNITYRLEKNYIICTAKHIFHTTRYYPFKQHLMLIEEATFNHLSNTLGLAIVKRKYYYDGSDTFDDDLWLIEHITIQHNTEIKIDHSYIISIYEKSTQDMNARTDTHQFPKEKINNEHFHYFKTSRCCEHDVPKEWKTPEIGSTTETEYYFYFMPARLER